MARRRSCTFSLLRHCCGLSDCDARRGRRLAHGVDCRTWGFVRTETRWFCLGVRHADHRHRISGGTVRPLLHVAQRSRSAVLFSPARIHGGDGGDRALRQSAPASFLLGADQPVFVLADQLLASQFGCEGRRTDGAGDHLEWRTLPLCRRPADRSHRRQLRSGQGVGVRRGDPFASALCSRARADPARRPDQERPISLPFLAAARDGGSDSRIRLSALGNDGEGGRVSFGKTSGPPSADRTNGCGW